MSLFYKQKCLYLPIVFLILSCSLTGCGTLSEAESYHPEAFSTGKKGIAILMMTEHAPETLAKSDIALSYRIIKLGTNKSMTVSGSNSFLPGLYNNHNYCPYVMMLDPGFYYIDYISMRAQGRYIRWYPSPGLKSFGEGTSAKQLFQYGAFEVKPGKISYFGHLKYAHSFPFTVVNDIQKVREDLRCCGMGELSEKVEFDTFYQPRTFMMQDEKGEKVFVPWKEVKKTQDQFINMILEQSAKNEKLKKKRASNSDRAMKTK